LGVAASHGASGRNGGYAVGMKYLALLPVLLVLSCSGETPSNTLPHGPKTDTFPQFYGEVPTNILMISMDTFRRDNMGRYDPDFDSTPFLTGLAAGGVALDNHTTCSNWTFAGMSCTLQGRYNEESGFTPKLTATGQLPWPEDTFLAGHLKQQFGMVSVASSTNGWFDEEWGMTQGYDESFHPRNGSAYGAYSEGRDALLARLDETDGETPWFLHVHLIEPHVPYLAPESYEVAEPNLEPIPWDLTEKDDHYDLTRSIWPDLDPETQDLVETHLRIKYRAELSYMDDQIQDMIADLERRGLLEDTLVVFWTDHGEQFWEHGYQSHAYTLFREENDGIALFWAKNIVPAAWTGPTTSIDIAPTLLSLLGGEVPEMMTGVPLGEADDDRARFAFTIARVGAIQSVRQGDLKLIFSWSGGLRMFDLSTDPGELNDLYDPTDPRVLALWALLEPHVALAGPLAPELTLNLPRDLTTE
jgi:arylsulfatase A-like enzyme